MRNRNDGMTRMSRFHPIILGSLLLVSCANQPAQKVAVQGVPQATGPEKLESSEPAGTDMLALPNVELTEELLYRFLLADIASQRGEMDMAATVSAELAQQTRDPRVAMRAAHLAMESGRTDRAISAIKFWQEVEPASAIPARMLSSVLVRAGRFDEARVQLASSLRANPQNAGTIFIHLYQALSGYPDKAAALNLMSDVAQPYPRVPEARWATAQLAQGAGDRALALREIRLAGELRPDWAMAVSLEAALLQSDAPQSGLDALERFLVKHPDAREIRVQYARALLDQKQYGRAREEFVRLANDNPHSPEMAFAIALISLQMEDYEGAETQLKQSLDKGQKDQDTARYYLGQLYEFKRNDAEAITHYRLVKNGEYQFAARIRAAHLLGKRGEPSAAIDLLRQTPTANNQQQVELILVESRVLFGDKQRDASYGVLQRGLEKFSDHPDLLYETAMVAERSDKPGEAEKLLRHLIRVKPDHAQGYNALGYSLLERKERIPEAVALVEKALQLAPDDAAIIDSVGWGYYLSGRLTESIVYLKRAFASSPDPEIAAHLGEALWVSGDQESAEKIWRDSLNEHADSEPLQAAIKKFMP
jgi:Flp pilus assembly protein TadD